jgi:hypothetical protein
MDIAVWKKKFPDCKGKKIHFRSSFFAVICPKKAQIKIEKVVQVEGFCEDVLPAFGIQVHTPDGLKFDGKIII